MRRPCVTTYVGRAGEKKEKLEAVQFRPHETDWIAMSGRGGLDQPRGERRRRLSLGRWIMQDPDVEISAIVKALNGDSKEKKRKEMLH